SAWSRGTLSVVQRNAERGVFASGGGSGSPVQRFQTGGRTTVADALVPEVGTADSGRAAGGPSPAAAGQPIRPERVSTAAPTGATPGFAQM
ncbi:MAG TPA: hypothetical protein VIL71_08575, partial [Spirillospora sp.]